MEENSEKANHTLHGPLAGLPTPLHGGAPGTRGCNGCTDCCHLPEISVTDEEAIRLRKLYAEVEAPGSELCIDPDVSRAGWQIMQGPCAFRQLDATGKIGGCGIYAERPGSCVVFTCALLLRIRRGNEMV